MQGSFSSTSLNSIPALSSITYIYPDTRNQSCFGPSSMTNLLLQDMHPMQVESKHDAKHIMQCTNKQSSIKMEAKCVYLSVRAPVLNSVWPSCGSKSLPSFFRSYGHRYFSSSSSPEGSARVVHGGILTYTHL